MCIRDSLNYSVRRVGSAFSPLRDFHNEHGRRKRALTSHVQPWPPAIGTGEQEEAQERRQKAAHPT
eukprot:9808394-Lingulodinium_polyedra.AAC.1